MSAPLKMDPRIRARWVAALRSGEYPQAFNHLRTDDGFCCYGVLCELAVQDGVIPPPERDPLSATYSYAGAGSLLPPPVKAWAKVNFKQMALAKANDGWTSSDGANHPSVSFAQIADLIEGGAS
jgi:hypothetical protein